MSTSIQNNPPHLLNKSALPAIVRFGVPLFLIGVVSLLIPSDFGPGVSADARIDDVGIEISIREISVISSVKELWNAESELLAILIVVFSIAWPYLNLLLTLLVWVTPWKTANAHRRETFIAVLDALGKWGLFDTFVLIVMMGGLRIVTDPAAIGLGALSGVTEEGMEGPNLRTYLTPLWGFYGFFIAALLSLIGSHLVLYYQRKVIYFNGHNTDVKEGDPEEQMKDDGHIEGVAALTALSGISICNPIFYIIPSILMIAFIVIGFFINVVSFTYNSESETHFSLYSLGIGITDAPLPDTNKTGPRFMAVIYFLMSLVIPVLNIITFVILYLKPMKREAQKIALYIAEVSFAWSTTGPLVFSLFTSVHQVPRFANSLIGGLCDGCLLVESELKAEVTVYLFGTMGHGIAAYYLLHKAHTALYYPPPKI